MSTLQYGYAYRLVVYPRVTRRGQGALQLQSVPICISLYLKERRSKSNYLSRGDTLSCAVAAETRGGGARQSHDGHSPSRRVGCTPSPIPTYDSVANLILRKRSIRQFCKI